MPLIADAILTSRNMTEGTDAVGAIHPPGFVDGRCPHHHQRGHLIGKKLGGSGSEWMNLVTLTDGTNHPIMYEFEEMVFRYVKEHPGMEFTYRVTACYAAAKYLRAPAAPGGADMGAANNPYCPLPCPESLQIDFFHAESNEHFYPIAIPYLAALHRPGARGSGALLILNGVYKIHNSVIHERNDCWAFTRRSPLQDRHMGAKRSGLAVRADDAPPNSKRSRS